MPIYIYYHQSSSSTHYLSGHLPTYLPIRLPIHLFSHSSIRLIIYSFYMPNLKYIQETITAQGNGLIKNRRLNQDQQDRVETAVTLLREGRETTELRELSQQQKLRGRRAQTLIRLIIDNAGANSALLCGMCVARSSLSDLSNNLHQPLCTWLATEGPKLDESTLQLFDQNVREAFGVENQCAKIADPPTSSFPSTGQKRRLQNTSNERPPTAPHATTVAQVYGEASTPEHVATCVIEETGEKGQKDQDSAQLPEWMCKSQSLHYTSLRS